LESEISLPGFFSTEGNEGHEEWKTSFPSFASVQLVLIFTRRIKRVNGRPSQAAQILLLAQLLAS